MSAEHAVEQLQGAGTLGKTFCMSLYGADVSPEQFSIRMCPW
ncbi:hypothetical protein P3T18_001091 [Paraburkholderia sp. GAS199]